MRKHAGKIAFAVLLIYCTLGARPDKVLAQAGAGYTKIGTSTTLTFTDSTTVDGAVYQYQVTATQSVGGVNAESTPATSPGAQIPATGTHSVTLSWAASTTPGVTYNIYRTGAISTNPPGAVSLTVN